jgi:arginyl-tRNA synthetase
MNVFKDFENRIKQAVQALDAVQEKGGEVSFERLAVEPPRDPAHGDISTNAAMVLAKPLGMNPRASGRHDRGTVCR